MCWEIWRLCRKLNIVCDIYCVFFNLSFLFHDFIKNIVRYLPVHPRTLSLNSRSFMAKVFTYYLTLSFGLIVVLMHAEVCSLMCSQLWSCCSISVLWSWNRFWKLTTIFDRFYLETHQYPCNAITSFQTSYNRRLSQQILT